jgi:hypothetical protein
MVTHLIDGVRPKGVKDSLDEPKPAIGFAKLVFGDEFLDLVEHPFGVLVSFVAVFWIGVKIGGCRSYILKYATVLLYYG